MLTDFEAYLLDMMRATDQVAAVLTSEGISRAELGAKAQRAVKTWQLDTPGRDAAIYQDAIGKAVSQRILSCDDTVPQFVGSICRLYRLPLWPKLLFQVNQHPSGFAWGESFVQDLSAITLPAPTFIRPWDWVLEAIEQMASKVDVLEHWNYEKDIRVVVSQGSEQSVYLAKFDLNLLQEWTALAP
jgi:hypothetical protein